MNPIDCLVVEHVHVGCRLLNIEPFPASILNWPTVNRLLEWGYVRAGEAFRVVVLNDSSASVCLRWVVAVGRHSGEVIPGKDDVRLKLMQPLVVPFYGSLSIDSKARMTFQVQPPECVRIVGMAFEAEGRGTFQSPDGVIR